jgi:hypothetical protein
MAQWRLRSRWPSDAFLDLLYANVRRLGFSASDATIWLRELRVITQRTEARERVQAARALDAAADARAQQVSAEGFCRIAPGELPGADAALDLCHNLIAEARAGRSSQANVRGRTAFSQNIISDLDFLRYPALVNFFTSEPLIRSIAGYLGSIPWLTSASLMWTLPNDLSVSSQLFHIDHIDTIQAKLFVAVEDIDTDCGPTAFFGLSDTETIKAKLGKAAHKRMKDEAVFTHVPRDRLQVMSGPRGFSYIADTCRCIHYGSRGNKRERFLLMVNYNQVVMPRVLAEYGGEKSADAIQLPRQPLTPLQQMVLRLMPR